VLVSVDEKFFILPYIFKIIGKTKHVLFSSIKNTHIEKMNKENILNAKHKVYELESTFQFENDTNVYKGFIGETSKIKYSIDGEVVKSIKIDKDQYVTADKINLVSDSILQKDIDLQNNTQSLTKICQQIGIDTQQYIQNAKANKVKFIKNFANKSIEVDLSQSHIDEINKNIFIPDKAQKSEIEKLSKIKKIID
jgi:hypothetical protein